MLEPATPKRLTLRELRKDLGVRQQRLASIVEMTQSELSKLERRDDHLVSTVRKIIEGLGGELEIVVKLGDERIQLVGV